MTPQPTVAQQQELTKRLKKVRDMASWQDIDQEGLQAATAHVLEMEALFVPGQVQADLDRYSKIGKENKELMADFAENVQSDLLSAKSKSLYIQLCKNGLSIRASKQLKFAVKHDMSRYDTDTWQTRIQHIIDAYNRPEVLNAFTEIVPIPLTVKGTEHRISRLSKATKWTLLIDETGNTFEETAEKRKPARIVGVLLSDPCSLPPLRGFHGAQSQAGTVLEHLNTLLSHPCGILGIELEDLHKMNYDKWLAALIELVHWAWRLIPLDNQNSSLTVIVENRGVFNAALDLSVFKKALNVEFDKESPERRKLLPLSGFRFVGKTAHNWIAWADVIAYCWGTGDRTIKTALKSDSGLLGTCLLEGVRKYLPIWEQAFVGKIPLEVEDWHLLQQRPDAEAKGSITWGALQKAQEACRTTPELWGRYLTQLNGYLGGKRYDLSVVEREVNWLSPMGAAKLRNPTDLIFWKLAELAHFNHQGVVGTRGLSECMKKVEELAPKFRKVMPEVYCQAQLRLAVADANALDFDAALQRLAPWDTAQGGSRLGATPLWYGKVLSSLGQYSAFRGDANNALGYFKNALSEFDELDLIDPEQAQGQKGQTSIYASIAAQDAAGLSKHDCRAYLEKALEKPLGIELIGGFGKSGDSATRYLHHAVLRYLVRYGEPGEKEAYRSGSSQWFTGGPGTGHPWPLIQFYRALLVPTEPKLYTNLIQSAHDDAWKPSRGLTMYLIGLTIAVASGLVDKTDPRVRSGMIKMRSELPNAASRMDILLDPNGPTGLDLIKKVLPFNYC